MIQSACNQDGIYASPVQQDNYMRVWARDSIIAGIAGLLIEDEKIIAGLKSSILTLSKHQLEKGTIPSNVQSDPKLHVSYGSLVGRVDATSWFLIGACLYTLNSDDQNFISDIKNSLEQAEFILNAWEFNNKDLIYTPLSGNWADEYVMHGYLLYDNCLRLWALQLLQKCIPNSTRVSKIDQIKNSINTNFWPQENASFYHPKLAAQQGYTIPYFQAGFNPSRYYGMFDAGGNGLALMLLNIEDSKKESLDRYLSTMSKKLIPAFWPTIKPSDQLYADLEMNYDFEFKNKPHHFHNGGIWPVMMGIFALGLSQHDEQAFISTMLADYFKIENPEELSFSEYISSDEYQLSGKKPLCFSAAGTIFMIESLNPERIQSKLHLI